MFCFTIRDVLWRTVVVTLGAIGGSVGCSSETLVEDLQGTWEQVISETDSGDSPTEKSAGMIFTFSRDKLVTRGADEGPDEFTYELNRNQEPKTIDLILPHLTSFDNDSGGVNRVERLLGIYKLDGGVLTIALRLPTAPHGPRPTEFKFEKGTVSVIALTRSRSHP